MLRKIKLRNHLDIFYLVTSFWTFFLLGGLWSEYYQTWSFVQTLIFVDLIPAIAMILIGPSLIKRFSIEKPIFAGFFVAFYFSIPFLVYDYIYIFLYLNKSYIYLIDYWYLTFFSIIPWINFPLTGYYLNKKKARY